MERLRSIAASYWTALVLGVLALALHVRWYTVDKAPGGEVLSGFGAALVVLGVFVGSRPYIRVSLSEHAESGAPDMRMSAYVPGPDRDAIVAANRRALIAERVVAVVVVVLGTLLNGYGTLIARLLHLRAS